MEANLLVYDVGSTYTKLTAFRLADGVLTYTARAQAPTTIEDIEIGVQAARGSLAQQGVTVAAAPAIYSTSSAAGGLRMIALGYMPRVTAKAAKEVAMSAGARVLEIVNHEDPPEYRLQVLREIKPDIVLLAGGTDGGDRDSLIENARIIVQSGSKAVIIIAGNKDAQGEAADILARGGVASIRVPNVMPTIHELKVKPAREAIHEQFIKQITQAKGLHKLLDVISDQKVMPTPGAVLLGAELLAKGTYTREGVGDMLVIDIGGATTDIHSVLPELDKLTIEEKGLVVTNEKQPSYRTVEGNLGLRISATGIVEAVGPQGVLAKIGKQGEELQEQLLAYTAFLEKNPEHISRTETEREFDLALAAAAIEVALKRHAGYISQEFNPVMGIVPGTPLGRDLRRVRNVIAVGGIFTHRSAADKLFVLKQAFANPGISLLPTEPRFIVDENYLLYAVGVLGQKYSDACLAFARRQFGLD
ncbi:glutamate mutase L [Anaeroselena agilis]|uniref:Glutamate mutase L n=1 Tax=Anaeroselena agilis TaxID=3063788 RepID=A0ABU3P2M7_9FIRM|nr:glutamate mutase L [Selenomonadales bacterium 4137-cl]